MKQMNKEESVTIELTREEAVDFYGILCELPFETPGITDTEPPTWREAPIEKVIDQIGNQIDLDDEETLDFDYEVIDDDDVCEGQHEYIYN